MITFYLENEDPPGKNENNNITSSFMKHITLVSFFLFFFLQVNAQLGIVVHINKNEFVEWQTYYFDVFNSLRETGTSSMFNVSTGLTAGYLLRMKNIRIDIYPNVGYSISNKEVFKGGFAPSANTQTAYRLEQIDFTLSSRIYPFDLKGNNQPTVITKKNRILKQGFYFSLNPSITMLNVNRSLEIINGSSVFEYNYSSFHFKVAAGLGLDIAISESMTISPYITYAQIDGVSNDIVNDNYSLFCVGCAGTFIEEETTRLYQFQFGLNFIFERVKVKE